MDVVHTAGQGSGGFRPRVVLSLRARLIGKKPSSFTIQGENLKLLQNLHGVSSSHLILAEKWRQVLGQLTCETELKTIDVCLRKIDH